MPDGVASSTGKVEMEIKKTLGDYTHDEFKSLVSTLWNADLDNETHNRLIDHFDKIIGDPLGADLLFYPPYIEAGNVHSVDSIVFHVQQWHYRQGKAAFRNEPAPTPPPPPVRLNPQQRKVAESNKDLDKTRQMIARIHAAVNSANDGLLHLIRLLDQWQAQPLDSRPVAVHIAEMGALEMAQTAMVRSIKALERMQQKVQFALSGAERNLTSPFRDAAIQSTVLDIITQGSNHYLASLVDVEQRHRQLHERCVPLFVDAEEHLLRRLSAPGAEIDKTPKVVALSSRAAQLRPAFMFADAVAIDDPQSLVAMKKTIRSAVAEFSWQATSLKDEHPGTFCGVAGFFFEHWKERHGYVVSVPLGDLMPTEGHDWQALARSGAEVDLPYRLFSRSAPVERRKIVVGLKEITAMQQICLTPTGGGELPSRVKVVAVTQTLSHPVPGFPSMELRWGMANTPQPAPGQIGGMADLPETPLLESLAAVGRVACVDCILVFPADSGLEPLYLMFKRARVTAG